MVGRLGQPREQHHERQTGHQVYRRRHVEVEVAPGDAPQHDAEGPAAGSQWDQGAPDLGQGDLADVEGKRAVGHAEAQAAAEPAPVEPAGALGQHNEHPAQAYGHQGEEHGVLAADVVDRGGADEGTQEAAQV